MVGKLVEHRLAELAARQHGVVSRAQLVALGLSRQAVDKRVAAGRLHRLHRGVYAVGHARLSREGRFMAAVLACGQGAVISHGSAALLWGLPWRETGRIDVTVPTPGGRACRRLVVVHRSSLAASDVARRHGIPVTTPSRTLVDLADHGTKRTLERAIDEAHYLRFDLSALVPRPGRRGSGLLRTVLGAHDAGATRTRSQLEERFLGVCATSELPPPEVNARIAGFEVDFVWRSQRLVVETDGHRAHGTRPAFERDRLRDAALVEAGWRVVRITHRRLAREPEAVAAQVSRLLRRS